MAAVVIGITSGVVLASTSARSRSVITNPPGNPTVWLVPGGADATIGGDSMALTEGGTFNWPGGAEIRGISAGSACTVVAYSV